MIEYTKLFMLLKDRNMKKTDLLEVISSQTLAKLGKNEVVKTETIDRLCTFLGVQPNSIMEVYELCEVDGNPYKVKIRDIHETDTDISYGWNTRTDMVGITWSDLSKVVNEKGYIDTKKLDNIIEKFENDKYTFPNNEKECQ